MEYTLKKAGCVPFEITESEYDAFVKLLKENRAKKVREEIMNLCKAIGASNAKTVVRSILKELED